MKSEIMCEKLSKDMERLKVGLTAECDEILGKIDELLAVEVLTFDRVVVASDAQGVGESPMRRVEVLGGGVGGVNGI